MQGQLLPEAIPPPGPAPGMWDPLSSQGPSLSPGSNQAAEHLPLADAADSEGQLPACGQSDKGPYRCRCSSVFALRPPGPGSHGDVALSG